MAEITAKMVKELRDKTDAGMMDCKKALAETNGDMEAAVEYLRKSGMAKAEKRAAIALPNVRNIAIPGPFDKFFKSLPFRFER